MSKVPHKLTIEITGDGYSYRLTSESGIELYKEEHEMEGPGRARGKQQGDIWDSALGEEYPNLADAIDEIGFGPFGVASRLHKIAEFGDDN